jgi:hypothetical protein
MSSFFVRPRFSQIIPMDEPTIQAQLIRKIRESGTDFEVKLFPEFICVRIPENERKFWSPRLTLSLEANPNGGTLVHGIYGPNAEFWSFYLYTGLIITSIALFSGILGVCQHSLGMNAWGLWVFSGSLGIALGLYLMAKVGQKLAAHQTFRLHQAYEAALGTSVDVEN